MIEIITAKVLRKDENDLTKGPPLRMEFEECLLCGLSHPPPTRFSPWKPAE